MSACRAIPTQTGPSALPYPCEVYDGDECGLSDTSLFAAFNTSHQTKQESSDSDDFVGATGVALHLAREEVGITKHLSKPQYRLREQARAHTSIACRTTARRLDDGQSATGHTNNPGIAPPTEKPIPSGRFDEDPLDLLIENLLRQNIF